MRTHKHHSKTEKRRSKRMLNERIKLMKERDAHERAERDAMVTAEHGEQGHWSCGRKMRYPTKSAALMRASKCQRRGAPALRAYRCPYCGGWHLTSK